MRRAPWVEVNVQRALAQGQNKDGSPLAEAEVAVRTLTATLLPPALRGVREPRGLRAQGRVEARRRES
jgi:hypothetical protein